MCVAENRAASLHPLVVSFTFVHVKPPMKPEYLFCKKSQNFIGKALRIFQHRNVGSIQFEVTSAGDLIGEKAPRGGGGGGRGGGGNHHHGTAISEDGFPRVKIRGGAATADVAIRIERLDGANDSGDHVGRIILKVGSKPAWRCGAGNFFHAVGSNRFDSCVPGFESSDFNSGAAQDEFPQTTWRFKSECYSNHSADRKTAQVKAIDAQRIDQR